jgi:cytochrome b561
MNRPDGFGWVSRLLHWTMAAAIVGNLILGTRIADAGPSLALLDRIALHKSLGLTLLVLVIARIVWHRVSPPPAPLAAGPAWQPSAARASHLALYALMVATPLAGWIGSAASGIDTLAWGWTLPRIAPVSAAWQDGFLAVHGILTKLLMAVVGLHVAAALWHGVRGDPTLARMIGG